MITVSAVSDVLLEQLHELPADRPFTSREADQRGVHNHVRRALVAAGLLRRPVRGVFVRADLVDTLDLRIQILKLVVPADCVVTDRSAAWLWGATMVLAPGAHLAPPPVSVFAPPGRRLRNGLSDSGERRLSRRDVVELDGLQVTTPLRTACDAARLLHRDQAIGVMDMLARLGRFSVEHLATELQRFKGYRGIVQARVLAPLVDPRAESPMESVLRLRWIDAGLPTPECQIEVPAPNGSYFLDIGSREHRFAAEYDGEAFHGTDDDEHDAARREWARGEGGGRWTIVVARRDNVFGRKQDAEQVLRNEFRALTRRNQADPSETR